MTKLLPAKNLRFRQVRVCATCQYLNIGDGYVECQREHGIYKDVGEVFHWIMVCDRWKKASK